MNAPQVIIQIGGLQTDPNPSVVQPGAAQIAENVWFPREGECEPRPGFYALNTGTIASGNILTRLGTPLSGDGNFLYFYGSFVGRDLNNYVTSPVSGFINVDDTYDGYESANGNWYVCDEDDGVIAIPNTGSARRAGLPRPTAGRFTASTTALADTVSASSQVAYQITYSLDVGTSLSPRIIESAPSPLFYYRNTSAQDRQPTLRHYLSSEITTRHVVNLYRTLEVAVTEVPNFGQLYLSRSVSPTSTDISNGYVDINDKTTEELLQRNALLYTNTVGGDGAIAAKYAPPKAKVLKYFNNMMFYGNVTTTPSLENALYQNATSTYNLTVSAGSNKPTPKVGVAGQYLSPTSSNPNVTSVAFPAGTYWTNASTVSNLAIGFAASVPYANWSQVAYQSTNYYVTQIPKSSESAANNILGAVSASPSGTDATTWAIGYFEAQKASQSLAWQVAQDYPDIVIDPTPPPKRVIDATPTPYTLGWISMPSRPGVAFSQSSRNTLQLVPTTETQYLPARLYYSLLNEPEAVTLTNFIDIGNRSKAILGLAKTRDSLFVFKEDGTWRITGTSPDDLVLTEFDTNLILFHPRAFTEMNNHVYAWTNYGIVDVTENGWEQIDAGYVEQALLSIYRKYAIYSLSNANAVLLQAMPEQNLLFVFTPDSNEPVYTCDVQTRKWATWQFYNSDDNPYDIEARCFLSYKGAWYVGGRTSPEDPAWTARPATVRLQTTYNATTPTTLFSRFYGQAARVFTSGSEGTPGFCELSIAASLGDNLYRISALSTFPLGFEVNDGLVANGLLQGNVAPLMVCVSVVSSHDGYFVNLTPDIGNPSFTYSCRYIKSFPCTWRATPVAMGNPAFVKEWDELNPSFSSLRYTRQGKIGITSDTYPTLSEITATYDPADTEDYVRSMRSSISRYHCYSSEISPQWYCKQGGAAWRLRGFTIPYRPVSDRADSRR